MTIQLDDELGPTPESKALTGPCRVLGFDGDRVLLIDLPKEDPKQAGRMLDYLGAPRWESTEEMNEHKRRFRIHVLNPPDKTAKHRPDSDLLAQAKGDRARKKIERQIRWRDDRFRIVRRVLKAKSTDPALLSAVDAMNDSRLSKRIKKAADSFNCSLTTVYNLLHRFWAGGSVKNALFTGHDRCGNPGQCKAQNNSLGRKTRAFKAKRTKHRCYVLDAGKGRDAHLDPASDKQKLAYGWRLIRHGHSVLTAFDLVSAVFWADHVVEKGRLVARLWDVHLRPTFSQFKRWGRKLNKGRSATEFILGERKWATKTESLGGSEQDMVTMVGQLAGFDGTKTDVYLASSHSVLKKLPPMLRLTIKDIRSDVICGWYLGWEPASPLTARQAIFHAAASKVAECARLGIVVTDEVIPAILHRGYIADNGELKAQAITEMEEQFGFSVSYTGRPEKKGGIESQQHTDHKRLDHDLSGSSGGKPRARGEDHAALDGLLNSYQYRREYVYHVIEHNNGEVPHLWPTEMRINSPELRPTRINIFNWLRQRQSAELPRDIAALRAYALPDVEAVIHKNGVYPLINIEGTKVLIPRFRFSSPALLATGLLLEVKRTGKTQRVKLKFDKSNPQEAWLSTKAGVIPLACVTRRERISDKLVLADWVSSEEDRLLAHDARAGVDQQGRVNTQLRRGGVELGAKKKLAEEIAAIGKKPSKAETIRDLDKNLDDEKRLERRDGRDKALPPPPANTLVVGSSGRYAEDIAMETMQKFAPEAQPSATVEVTSAAARAMATLDDEEF